MLQREMSLARSAAFTDLQPLQADISDHASPQSIVEVEHETLARPAAVRSEQPPDKLSSYEQGGKVILGLLIVSGIAGLWVLWSPTKRKDA